MADDVDKKQQGNGEKPRGSGKFTKGNTAGSKTTGTHIDHTTKLKFAEIFKAAITFEDIKDIAAAMVKEARAGNVKAASMILDRCCGKPPQAIALTGADGEPLIPIQVIIQHGEVQI